MENQHPPPGSPPRPGNEDANPDLPEVGDDAGSSSGRKKRKRSVVGDFRLTGHLGEGAMGAVYRAQRVSTGESVALKVLFKHIASNPKYVERFYREARVTAKLNHPNIVRSFEAGEDHGWHYYAMELVEGDNVLKWLKRLGRFSVGDALAVAIACAHGLHYAHELDLVHRDIKPDNVLIGRDGSIKLTDLGMAKLLDELGLTQTGHGVGTPYYMPLEQARNAKAADRRCDIYALGCMLHCMLTGKPPFDGANLLELIQAKGAGTFAPARRSNPEVPAKLDQIIAKMAAKDPNNRYATCADVVVELERLGLANEHLSFLGGPPAPAKPAAKTPAASELAETRVTEPTAADWWFVRGQSAEGKPVTHRLNTAQVCERIADRTFDKGTKASRRLDEQFHPLSTYREFDEAFAIRGQALGKTKKIQPVAKEEEAGPVEAPAASGDFFRRYLWLIVLLAFLTVALLGVVGYVGYLVLQRL